MSPTAFKYSSLILCLSITVGGCTAKRIVPPFDSPFVSPVVSPVEAITSVEQPTARWTFHQRPSHARSIADMHRLAETVAQLTGSTWQGPDIQPGVLDSNRPNAYVLLSGQVYITIGLLDVICTDDELAAVVAHEMAHLQDPGGFRTDHLSLDERLHIEAEADARAALLLLDAQFDPYALVDIISRLENEQPQGWADERCSRLRALLRHPNHTDERPPLSEPRPSGSGL